MKSSETATTKGDKSYDKIIWEGEVVDVLDGEENGIIKVRIPELDKTITDTNLPLCYPLFSFSFFRSLPKKGERVTLMNRNIYDVANSNNKDIRYWISVVHSTITNTDYQPFFLESNAHFLDSPSTSPKKIKNIPSAKGIYPSVTDISISSRKNSTIFLKDSEILLRSGGHENNNPLIFNKKNPSYISVNFPNEPLVNTFKDKQEPTEKYIAPKITIIVQTNNTNATIQIKDKEKNALLLTTSYSKNSREELIFTLKKDILQFEVEYPYWELIALDAEFSGLPTVYSTNLSTVNEKSLVTSKTVDFSNILIVSDKLFLVSHLNNEFNLRQQPVSYTNEDLISLSNTGHPVPYGDKLVELLDLMRKAVVNHVHPYDGMKTVQEELIEKLLNYNLQSILNKNVLTG